MADAVTLAALFSNTWQNVFDLINANVTDPASRGTKWIYAGFPYSKIDNSDAYPLIVIENVTSSGFDILTMSYNAKTIVLSIAIDVYSTKSSELDTICDSIVNAMDSNSSTLFSNKLNNMRLASSSYEAIEREAIKIHHRSLVYEFEFDAV